MDSGQPERQALRSKFIVFDGPDGCGKSTVRQRVAERLRAAGLSVTECKDPGGTAIGDRIRGVLLGHDLAEMDIRCETLLFMASRAQLVSEIVRPALQAGHVVLCDRFVSATCAYQVAAGSSLDAVIELARYAIGPTWPDLTLILDVPVNVGFGRLAPSGSGKKKGSVDGKKPAAAGADVSSLFHDSMERRPLAFHEAVRKHFLELADHYPAPVEVVDGTRSVEAVVDDVMERLASIGGRRQ